MAEDKKKDGAFKVSDRVTLPIYEKGDAKYLPAEIDFKGQEDLLEQVSIAVNEKLPVLLVGETGTGKTSLVKHLANKTNHGFRRASHNGGTSTDDILGKILVQNTKGGTFWVDGILIDAMRRGDWYLADEINASTAEVNFAYHSLLDDDGYITLVENQGEKVLPHKEFRFFGAMNPTSSYAGTKELNKALLSRFIVINVDFPAKEDEIAILVERAGVTTEQAEQMVDFAGKIRSSHKAGKIDFVLSTRELIMWAKLYSIYKAFTPSAEVAILNKVNEEDFQAVKDLIGLMFSEQIPPKAKTKTSQGDVPF